MRVPQIRIEQTFAKLGMKTNNAMNEIRQPKAEINMKQEPALLEVTRTPSKLTIDQSQAWRDMELKSVFVTTAEEAEFGYQAVMEGIARRAQEGDRLARIHIDRDPIPDFHIHDFVKEPREFNVDFIPKYGSVKIHYEPTKLHFDWKVRGMTIDPEVKKPEVTYNPGKVDIYVAQNNSLKIDFIGIFTDESI